MTKFEKLVLYIPVIGLILKYQSPYFYKTTKTWDYYQLFVTVIALLYVFIYFIGFNITF